MMMIFMMIMLMLVMIMAMLVIMIMIMKVMMVMMMNDVGRKRSNVNPHVWPGASSDTLNFSTMPLKCRSYTAMNKKAFEMRKLR